MRGRGRRRTGQVFWRKFWRMKVLRPAKVLWRTNDPGALTA
jgi:hypothetical protein